MDFGKKLQELRKQKGITQEELAEAIFVSRTAVSKWESGRGYPNLDSIKAISKYFSVTVDSLLSGEQILSIAEDDNTQKESRIRGIVFGLLDVSVILLLFLPLFGQKDGAAVGHVSLLNILNVAKYIKVLYFTTVAAIGTFGILTLALQSAHQKFWVKNKSSISLALNAVAAVLFIISLQPYVSVLMFAFLVIKVFMLVKI